MQRSTKWAKKTVIGLTGGFGTGKSTVARMFEELGARVVSADKLAHEALDLKSPVYEKVVKMFGGDVIGPGGAIDRKKISEVVFQDPEKLRQLESLIHPFVFERIKQEIQKAGEQVVVLDVPLLFESKLNETCDRTVVVHAPEEITKERLLRKGFSEEEIRQRTRAQKPLSEKVRLADFVIKNQGSLEETRSQVQKVWKDRLGGV